MSMPCRNGFGAGRSAIFGFAVCLLMLLSGCTVSYSFSGVDIAPEVRTVSVKQFRNNASMVNLKLANELTTKLKEKFQSQTKLIVTDQMGDLQFEGQVTDYAVTATAVGSDKAAMNRLTITVKVKFVNTLDEKKSYESTFSRYADFSSTRTLEQVQDALVAEIVEALVDDMFTKAVTNW
ncbi:MAG: LptE family protein [Bacteroidales bacterium]|nr:LptE family protein [Bacteroidales bacterium]